MADVIKGKVFRALRESQPRSTPQKVGERLLVRALKLRLVALRREVMRKIMVKLAGLGIALGLLPGLALAQTDTGTQNQTPSDQQGNEPYHQHHYAGHAMRASKLLGTEVQSSQGEDLGKITDIIADPQSGQITFAVLQSSGAAGGPETKRAIPWKALNFQPGGQAIANISQSKLQSGPTLGTQMPELEGPDYVIEIYRFYGVEPGAMGGTGSGMGETGQGQGSSQAQPGSPNPMPNTPPQ